MRTRSLPDRCRAFRAFRAGALVAACILLAVAALPRTASAASAIGAPASFSVPAENWEARSQLSGVIFSPTYDAAGQKPRLLSQQSGAATVRFQVQQQAGSLYLVFSNPRGKGYPLDSAGTFIIKRSLQDGSFEQVKIFVQDDPGTYLRIFPDGDRTLMDAWLFGEPFQSGVALPVTFDRVLTAPLSSIIQWGAAAVDWPLLLKPQPGPEDQHLQEIVATLESRLRSLRDMDDGAMDGSGRMVYIATGTPALRGGFNCSGFAKWVVDGLYAPLAGHPMDIAPLKSRNAGKDNPWSSRFEEEMDPWFGLDWTRGLARTLALAQDGTEPSDSQVDVRDADHVAYIRDVGYPVPRLQALLYFLARRDPGKLYLGSVNAPSSAVSEGTPTLRQHHHVIVLAPYFDAEGAFQVVVMERNLKTSIPSLVRRYGTEYVHLVRIDPRGTFDPPPIPGAR
ncbi:MAG TPA: hypothetical protein VL359_09010 [bacterium]|nr:hypothetical protein [bacterium]